MANYKYGVKASLWRLLMHDLSKFSKHELPHYDRQFFGDADRPEEFIRAWVHHQNHNQHHWEYWIPRTGHSRCDPPYPDGEPIPMPMKYVREMVCDWLGAGRAYEGKWIDVKNWTWLEQAYPTMVLHQKTRNSLIIVLLEIGVSFKKLVSD